MTDRMNTPSQDPRWPDNDDAGSHAAFDRTDRRDDLVHEDAVREDRVADRTHADDLRDRDVRHDDVRHDAVPAPAAAPAVAPTAPVEPARASRKTSVGSGLLLILGGLLLASLVTLALGNDSAVTDGSTSEEPVSFYLMRVVVPAIGLVLMVVAYVLRRSWLTLSLVLLGLLALVGMVVSKVMGEQQLAATTDPNAIQWLLVLFVVCMFAAALVGLVAVIHGLIMLFRKGHVLRGSQARSRA